ncbi:hypothetical protein [Methylomicrobium lacus]|uniref:hypothetical protein n=1 Tax=Methylomicrobium lacus TaxID=136992 RepID=UPI0035A9888B
MALLNVLIRVLLPLGLIRRRSRLAALLGRCTVRGSGLSGLRSARRSGRGGRRTSGTSRSVLSRAGREAAACGGPATGKPAASTASTGKATPCASPAATGETAPRASSATGETASAPAASTATGGSIIDGSYE